MGKRVEWTNRPVTNRKRLTRLALTHAAVVAGNTQKLLLPEDRLVFNYVRHECTNYNWAVVKYWDDYLGICREVVELTTVSIPWLKSECSRWMNSKYERERNMEMPRSEARAHYLGWMNEDQQREYRHWQDEKSREILSENPLPSGTWVWCRGRTRVGIIRGRGTTGYRLLLVGQRKHGYQRETVSVKACLVDRWDGDDPRLSPGDSVYIRDYWHGAIRRAEVVYVDGPLFFAHFYTGAGRSEAWFDVSRLRGRA